MYRKYNSGVIPKGQKGEIGENSKYELYMINFAVNSYFVMHICNFKAFYAGIHPNFCTGAYLNCINGL